MRPSLRVRLAAVGILCVMASPALAAKDWSGVWVNQGSISFDPRQRPATPANPPYNATFRKEYDRRLKLLAEGKPIADPTADCVLPGVPRMMNMPYPFELLYTKDRITMIAEQQADVRRIWMDGRKHPDDPDPTYNGHSVGRWEGDVLIVDTVGLRGDTVFDQVGTFHSDAMTVEERFEEKEPGVLSVQITVKDPKAFTTPWVVTKTYHRRAGEEILEYVCEENNRNPIDAEGKTSVILTPLKR